MLDAQEKGKWAAQEMHTKAWEMHNPTSEITPTLALLWGALELKLSMQVLSDLLFLSHATIFGQFWAEELSRVVGTQSSLQVHIWVAYEDYLPSQPIQKASKWMENTPYLPFWVLIIYFHVTRLWKVWEAPNPPWVGISRGNSMTFPSTRQHFQSWVLKNANRQSSQIPLSTFMLSKNKILTHIRVAIISIVEMILVDFRFDFFLSFDSYILSFFYFLDSLFIWKCLS